MRLVTKGYKHVSRLVAPSTIFSINSHRIKFIVVTNTNADKGKIRILLYGFSNLLMLIVDSTCDHMTYLSACNVYFFYYHPIFDVVYLSYMQRGGDPLVLCFVDFADAACAATALSALQGKYYINPFLSCHLLCIWNLHCLYFPHPFCRI